MLKWKWVLLAGEWVEMKKGVMQLMMWMISDACLSEGSRRVDAVDRWTLTQVSFGD